MSTKSTFTEGDVVMLKSGGPKMTIAKIHHDRQCYCNWFEGNKHFYATFPESSLIDPPKDTPVMFV